MKRKSDQIIFHACWDVNLNGLEDVRHYLSNGLCIVVGNGKSRVLGGLKDLHFSSI